jgi:hypothetical protein
VAPLLALVELPVVAPLVEPSVAEPLVEPSVVERSVAEPPVECSVVEREVELPVLVVVPEEAPPTDVVAEVPLDEQPTPKVEQRAPRMNAA